MFDQLAMLAWKCFPQLGRRGKGPLAAEVARVQDGQAVCRASFVCIASRARASHDGRGAGCFVHMAAAHAGDLTSLTAPFSSKASL